MKAKTTSDKAAAYAREHSTGNSYYDSRIEMAYEQGAAVAIVELGSHMLKHLPAFYQRMMNEKIKEMNGE